MHWYVAGDANIRRDELDRTDGRSAQVLRAKIVKTGRISNPGMASIALGTTAVQRDDEGDDDIHHEASLHMEFLGHHPDEHHEEHITHGISEDAFEFKPVLFEGMPERGPVKEPQSFVFQHIVKKTNEFIKTREALKQLHDRHNDYAQTIAVHRDVPYLSADDGSDKHKLDIWVPVMTDASPAKLPICVHFHGGGWIRGDRKDEFRGAPAACRQYAHNGIIAVAPSYRLRDCPGHMEDAVAAVEWSLKHAELLGADPRTVFLSGHSAGGNICANLCVGPWLDSLLVKYHATVVGAVCISGVYSLLNPLGGVGSSIKNKVFNKVYRETVFGGDLTVLARHGPSAQLRMALGEQAYPQHECKLCKLAHDFADLVHISREKSAALNNTDQGDAVQNVLILKDPEKILSTRFLVMNAEDDMGLDTDGKKFVKLLERVGHKHTTYQQLPGRTHASIALDDAALNSAAEFIKASYDDWLVRQ